MSFRFFPFMLALGLILTVVAPARSETVFVRSRGGEIGRGWLFGSAGVNPGDCWIVVPAHVVRSPETKALEPFFFSDTNGKSGESGDPISAGVENPATTAERDASDLAFARVSSGRRDGQCLSRLGVPTFVYGNLATANPRLTVLSTLTTSYGAFEAVIKSGAVDQFGGAVLDFGITHEEDSSYLKKMLSGATIIAERAGQPIPFAMVIRVTEDQHGMRGLRFDYIRERFTAIEAADAARHRGIRASTEGVPYRVLDYKAIDVTGSEGPSVLTRGGGCWRAAPSGGRRDVELSIELSDKLDRVESLALLQTEACNSGTHSFWIERRNDDRADWDYLGRCESRLTDSPACRIGITGPGQIRLRIEAKGPIAVSALILR
jgi:hypothetical protein